ncbi:MAG: hypothetical protein ACYS8X_07220 [Planctomycetota bacterium]|jgi:hypothetical protein
MGAVSHVILIILAALVVMAMVSVVRGFLRGVPRPKPSEFKPFIDFPPPPEVVATPGVRRLAWAAVVWATLNIGGLMAWAAWGFVPEGTEVAISVVQIVTIVGYLFVAAALAGVGGLLLLACRADGRRMLAWSGFLFVTISMLGMGLALIYMRSDQSGVELRQQAKLAALAVAAHFIVDTALATMAQRVGLPRTADQPAGEQ